MKILEFNFFSQFFFRILAKYRMGVSNSYPDLKNSETGLSLVDRNLEKIPFKISKKNKLRTVDVSGNNLKFLPKHLKHLVTMNLSRNSLSEFTPKMQLAVLSYRRLEVIDLSFNSLKKIPICFTKIPSLKRILAEGNKISEYDNFTGNIELVDLKQNRFTKMPDFNEKIGLICIDYNLINTIEKSYNNLIRLYANMNRISSIRPDLIFPNLEILEISKNLLSEIPNLTRFTPKLKKFIASNNKITQFPEFPSQIVEIDIGNNQISSIGKESLVSLKKLTNLDISQNYLESLPQLPPSIQVLNAIYNQITHVEPSETPCLKTVMLSKNCLTEYPNYVHNQATEIFITRNCLKAIPISCFTQNLVRLNATDNEIESLPSELFTLPKLAHLNVAKNKIKKLPETLSQSHLIGLNLSENPIENVPDYLPNSLVALYTSYTGISELPESISSLSNLITLVSCGNKLKKIPHCRCLKKLLLSRNQFEELPENLPRTLFNIDFSCNKLKKLPEDFYFPALIEADFSHNLIEELPESFNCMRLKTFKLSHNPKLKGSLDLQNFLNLDVFDYSFTNVELLPSNFDVREIVTSNPELFTSPQFKLITEESSWAAFAELCGQRDYMEDAIVVRPNLFKTKNSKKLTETQNSNQGNNNTNAQSNNSGENDEKENDEASGSSQNENQNQKDGIKSEGETDENEDNEEELNVDLYCVFDGHGGSHTSNFGAYQIVQICQSSKASFSEDFAREIVSTLIKQLRENQVRDGATLAMAMLSNKEVIFAHLGDSRAMLLTKTGEVRHSTVDHKPESRQEIDRILDMGGKVAQCRTNGIVAVSRCLGDFEIFGVGCEPTVTRMKLEKDDKWIIVACDGVFDVLTNKSISEIVAHANNATELAYDLRNVAYNRMCTDNISVVAVDIQNRNKNEVTS
ncbi:leucine-rich repeat-containing protein [Tritrichomonas foetus]|uniref:Leucine-rich repeat-containing protein n=1 Tax=Tritrichomonas foetus TaxID=1144522 RepID=A0A1J4KWH8_9EUKA|nr:leucine-rich repeat-containing protein [Tritrichomonas foetus]|eukprot:OHT15595.1 leucine-rich repeat-containing protein [Tritrichomonas foetus]